MATAERSIEVADPRPVIDDDGPGGPALVGARCVACGNPSPVKLSRCPRCASVMEEERFGTDGAIWSTTTIHVPNGEREAPYTLAYVDLDLGPRLLAHVQMDGDERPPVAARVRLIGRSEHGDPLVEVIE
jgi:uncharacterized OB-fold protein